MGGARCLMSALDKVGAWQLRNEAAGMLSCRFSVLWVRGRQADWKAGAMRRGGRRRACSEEVLTVLRAAVRTGSAIMKSNRTVGCLQTRTDTD
jgi:hypothetical protein